MSRSLKIVLFLSVLVFGGLWLNSQASRAEHQKKLEVLTYSQFRKMLTKQGRREIGTIYTRPQISKQKQGSLLSLLGLETGFALEISPRKITGRYLRPGNRIEASDDKERILQRTIPFVIESLPGMVSDSFLQELERNRIVYKFVNEEEGGFFSTLFSLLPIMLIVFILWIFMMRHLQNSGNRALSFGKSKARLNNTDDENKKKINFNDVAGCDEAKQELREVVDFLKDPLRFQNIGARVPRGVLLVGPPGTGKTLLARAVAGEAGVPFYSISGSDFVEMFVGVGASRMRDLFTQAKKNSPCILFIDEIDAVGRLRGAGLGGGHDEREQTLNQMLVEMDGFEEKEGIIVIAATNRPDVLDPALLRPGRFDRQVVVDVPDLRGRKAILEIYAAKIPITSDVSLQKIARGTPGFTGADLANLINEAAILAARRDKRRVTMLELEEAKDKVLMGPERRSFLITAKEKEVIAYHEGGHALLSFLLPYTEPVHKVTIVPRGRSLGLTQSLPEEDRHIQPKKYWEDRICALLGGYLAEKLIFEDTSTGASNDIQVVTKIAYRMVCEWGMSEEIGTLSYVNEDSNVFLGREIQRSRQCSEETASRIDKEVKRIVHEQLEKGRSMLKKNRKKLEGIAKALLAEESISGARLNALVNPQTAAAAAAAAIEKENALAEEENREEEIGIVETDQTGISPKPAPAH